MKKVMFLSLLTFLFSPLWAETPKPKIQIAILLDASNSMDGLIDQAKSRLWSIVNDLAVARKAGVRPQLEVAVYEYGKSEIPASEGHLRMLVPLTSDLDRVSEALFAVSTNGGEEYCGQTIRAATRGLSWSREPGDFKAVFIAGNEPFNQGPVNFREVCMETIAQGIVVNTIFCGSEQEGRQTFWKEGADMTDGQFMVIDQDKAIPVVSAPQDADILKLGQALNQTYVAYGAVGKKAKTRQIKQDQNAAAMSAEAEVTRTLTKASGLYETKSWDLVSAVNDGAEMEDMPEAELPVVLRDMNEKEREQWVTEKARERKDLETKLNSLKKERETWVKGQRQEATLDDAVSTAVRKQLKKKKFEY